MAFFDFTKNIFKSSKDKGGDKKTAKEIAAEKAAARRSQAFETGFVEHPNVQEEFKRRAFLVKNARLIRALIWIGIGLIVAIIITVIVIVVIQNLPGRDDDNDGVPNVEDVCPGFDDRDDADRDGVPDGCEEQPETTELTIVDTSIVDAGEDRYDVAVMVENPSVDWGASPLDFTIDLLAEDGSIINSSSRQSSYILPQQQKTLSAFNILAVTKPVTAELNVGFAEWLKVTNYTAPRFETTTLEFEVVEEPGVYARLKGRTKNLTTFTFDNVQISILLTDGSGNIIALNRSEIDTLNPGEERDFIVTFPQEIPDVQPANINYETDVDVFRNDTFVGTSVVKGQMFQQFTPQPIR